MHPAALSILLHPALELRLDRLEALLAQPGWALEEASLHRVRVAMRRLRAVLGLVEPGLYPAHARQTRKLEALTGLLGPTREADVQVQRLEALGHQLGGASAWGALEHALELLERQRCKARRRLLAGVEGRVFGGLRKLRRVPLLPDPFLPGDARRSAWDQMMPLLEGLRLGSAGLFEREETEALHGARIRVKHLRYGLEVLEEAFGVDLSVPLEALHRLQNALGEHHDLALLESFLWRLHGELQARRRPVLAEGTLQLLGMVAEARRGHFERSRTEAAALVGGDLSTQIRSGLGLVEPKP